MSYLEYSSRPITDPRTLFNTRRHGWRRRHGLRRPHGWRRRRVGGWVDGRCLTFLSDCGVRSLGPPHEHICFGDRHQAVHLLSRQNVGFGNHQPLYQAHTEILCWNLVPGVHSASPNISRSHSASPNISRSHSASPNISRSHSASPNISRSRRNEHTFSCWSAWSISLALCLLQSMACYSCNRTHLKQNGTWLL